MCFRHVVFPQRVEPTISTEQPPVDTSGSNNLNSESGILTFAILITNDIRMSDYLSQLLKSGRMILADTKQVKIPPSKKKGKASMDDVMGKMEQDPHKNFIKWCISEKPKPKEIVAQLKKFIEGAEAEL
jgi:hypothetical protein